jgi:hypothetical protein
MAPAAGLLAMRQPQCRHGGDRDEAVRAMLPRRRYEPESKGRYRVRVFSPLGYYPQHSIALPNARLLVNDELIVSSVYVEPPEVHGLEHSFELEYLALEETRFLAGIALAVHPDNGRAYTYPLHEHVDVDFGVDDDAVIEAAQQLATRIFDHSEWSRRTVPPPACGRPAYQWREAGVNVDNVRNVVCATQLNDHLLMRGLGALLRADMCCQHHEIADAAALQLYVALVAEIDSDAKSQAALLGEIQIAIGHCALNFAGTAHRVDHAREFRQHPVAGSLDAMRP